MPLQFLPHVGLVDSADGVKWWPYLGELVRLDMEVPKAPPTPCWQVVEFLGLNLGDPPTIGWEQVFGTKILLQHPRADMQVTVAAPMCWKWEPAATPALPAPSLQPSFGEHELMIHGQMSSDVDTALAANAIGQWRRLPGAGGNQYSIIELTCGSPGPLLYWPQLRDRGLTLCFFSPTFPDWGVWILEPGDAFLVKHYWPWCRLYSKFQWPPEKSGPRHCTSQAHLKKLAWAKAGWPS